MGFYRKKMSKKCDKPSKGSTGCCEKSDRTRKILRKFIENKKKIKHIFGKN